MPTVPAIPALPWFDAHLDLAYLAELGRDMHAELSDCRGRQLPAAVTLPSLHAGHVRACLATVFTEPLEPGATSDEPSAYPTGDALAAYRAGMRQLKLYQVWRSAGVVADLHAKDATALRVGILVENADPITSPDDLPLWTDAGVVAVGLTWTRQGRYAHGNTVESSPTTGLTPAGRDLVRALDAAGIVHDASHLNDRSLAELLDLATGRVIASHSNPRALLADPANQRHLTDDAIRAIASRGGIIGLNLFSKFLAGPDRPATIADAVRHITHVCDLVGDRAHIGLGSDMDGGFTADKLPTGIRTPSDLTKLADALSVAGWTDREIGGFAWGNWAGFWGG